jgi:hypothetical protein
MERGGEKGNGGEDRGVGDNKRATYAARATELRRLGVFRHLIGPTGEGVTRREVQAETGGVYVKGGDQPSFTMLYHETI